MVPRTNQAQSLERLSHAGDCCCLLRFASVPVLSLRPGIDSQSAAIAARRSMQHQTLVQK
jgi:hypothetical protein